MSIKPSIKFTIHTIAACIALVVYPSYGQTTDIIGRASVIDGDTIEIHGQHIRLSGIDAPEKRQLCEKDGQKYLCGQKAALALDGLLMEKTVKCHPENVDRYKRVVATCTVNDIDTNGWMVSHGWAVAYRQYSTNYINAEEAARQAKLGIWAGTFQMPSEYRKSKRNNSKSPQVPPNAGCLIKGNINAKGEHIYHMPGDKIYAGTHISPKQGERWFCTEKEAKIDGWRPAMH